MFFFEKKNQKTFPTLRAQDRNARRKRMKVSLLLFLQKKKTFLSSFQDLPLWTH
jgi:hypothetical protein